MSGTQPRGLPRCAIEAIMLAMPRPILPRYRPAYSYLRAIPYIFTVSVLPQTVFPLPLSRSRSPLRSLFFRFSQHALSRKFIRCDMHYLSSISLMISMYLQILAFFFLCFQKQNFCNILYVPNIATCVKYFYNTILCKAYRRLVKCVINSIDCCRSRIIRLIICSFCDIFL